MESNPLFISKDSLSLIPDPKKVEEIFDSQNLEEIAEYNVEELINYCRDHAKVINNIYQ